MTLIRRLQSLDPDCVAFHAARYESGRLLQEAIHAAHDGEPRAIVEDFLVDALEATPGDGGNYGVIPCLGGEPNDAWWAWQAGELG